MSYGCGTVFLPIVRRLLVGSLVIEVAYITYDSALKPGYKALNRALFPKSVVVAMAWRILCSENIRAANFRLCRLTHSPPKLESKRFFSTESAMQPHEHLDRFLSQFKRFRAITEKNTYRTRVPKEYEDIKFRLKESMRGLSSELDRYDVPSLLAILFHCLEMSTKCSNYQFNAKLVQLLISHFQSQWNSGSGHSTSVTKPLEADQTQLERVSDLSFHSPYFANKVAMVLKDEVHLIYLLHAILKLKLHPILKEHFEYFYISLNRNMSNYSAEDLIELSKLLGALYLYTHLDGLRTLLNKSVHALMDKADRLDLKVPIYEWIQLIKSINKCNENYLYKKLVPYLTSSIQSSPYFTAIFEARGTRELSPEDREGVYKFIKLTNHLFTNMLLTGMTDCLHLLELIQTVITKFLVSFAARSLSHVDFAALDQNAESEYNSDSDFIDNLLYKKYDSKLFRASSANSVQALRENTAEECALYSALLRLLHSNKVNFIRSVKLNEMYLRTVYPSVHARLNGSLLRAARLLAFQNEREYVRMHNILTENIELIRMRVPGNAEPLIALVDIYYIISVDYDKKLFIEVLDPFNRDRLRKNVEFKLNYLDSQGWKCIKVFK